MTKSVYSCYRCFKPVYQPHLIKINGVSGEIICLECAKRIESSGK